jgi:hypothetical protein
MAAEITHADDDHVMDDVFDTGDPRSFVDHLVPTEPAGTAAFEDLVSPVHAMWRIGSALLGMAGRASLTHLTARLSRGGRRHGLNRRAG